MEGYWPLPARLEVALALGLVPTAPASGAVKSGVQLIKSAKPCDCPAHARYDMPMLSPAGGAQTPGRAGGDNDDEVEMPDDDDDNLGLEYEDGPDTAPLQLPPPHEIILVDTLLPMGLGTLHTLLFAHRSPLMEAHWQAEGITDVNVGPWQCGGDDGCLRSRTIAYTKRLSIPVPLAPKQCKVR